MGLDIYLEAELKEEGRYPEHFMKANYLRSSYNPSGFNNIVPVMTGDTESTFYGIFAETIDDFTVEVPDEGGGYNVVWKAEAIESLERAKVKAIDVAEKIKASPGFYTEDIIIWKEPEVESDDVVSRYHKEVVHNQERLREVTGSYSHGGNQYYMEGITVYAAMPSMKWGKQCVSLVCEMDQEIKDHYEQAAYIAAEFCQLAIDTIKDQGQVGYVWSG